MNTLLRSLLGVFILTILGRLPAVAADAPAGFRLTVELRDGSRVIGLAQDKEFIFQSAILGELKLPLLKIRSVEADGGTNLFKLTTADADSLKVGLAMEEIRVVTTYGKVSLPVAMIKSVRVSPTGGGVGRPMDGLIALWSGEGNAVDSVAGNNGTLVNVSFTDGVVGRAFSFMPDSFPYGTYCGVQIPDRPAYELTKSLTIEAWVRPRGNGYTIFFRGDHRPGLDPYCLSMQASHDLRFEVCGADGNGSSIDTTLPYLVWTHVAAVLDDSAGTISLYTNGVLAVQTSTDIRPFGALQPDQSPGIGIGNLNDGGNNFPFIGDIDEVGLYNRALSAAEVNAIYAEHAADAGNRADPLPPRNFHRPMRTWPSGINYNN
jgi:hypothetical protein